ncbi:serine rich endogenous peptide 16 [Raphanus sativus]|uniref:Serine rich endogenous peptide 16 n=1 Tax=Raphanus sativus TaxID=3726 RepID=A0A9W3D524_RAPSA|nr:serine rich endogenous peptide 16 [Raphanus sativus]
MAKERSHVIALLLLSLLLCLSSQSQVGVAEAKRHTLSTTYLDSRCANEIPASPPRPRIPPKIYTPHSRSRKGKGP